MLHYLRFYLGSLVVFFGFYLTGHYLLGLPFPTPVTLLQIALGAGAGVGLGILYHRIWPLPEPGIGRVIRLVVLLPPAFMLGIGLLILLQAQVALHLLVPLLAWLTPEYGSQNPSTPKRPSRG
ncbi:hypothetical protein KQ693_06595 [Thermus sp. PS18]|uniref:hypothetical protein n=1 Tax=Thermus sp. PS18 TaxID=2849039 RepID=UPI0022656DC9|nr:hypothetical protein [Thermus sp. PS18]UZX16694.1 hypothetical protein KQ693_06595 [Thermus sp. PS18]